MVVLLMVMIDGDGRGEGDDVGVGDGDSVDELHYFQHYYTRFFSLKAKVNIKALHTICSPPQLLSSAVGVTKQ